MYYFNLRINFSAFTINRLCMPLPVSPLLSYASTVNKSSLSLISANVALATIFSPIPDARICSTFSKIPTLVCALSKKSARHFTAAFSIRATIDGVAKTGKLPEPTVIAVLLSSTVVMLCADNPNFVVIKSFFTSTKLKKSDEIIKSESKKVYNINRFVY